MFFSDSCLAAHGHYGSNGVQINVCMVEISQKYSMKCFIDTKQKLMDCDAVCFFSCEGIQIVSIGV